MESLPAKAFSGGIWDLTARKACPVCGGGDVWTNQTTNGAYCPDCHWSRNLERTAPAPKPTLWMCPN